MNFFALPFACYAFFAFFLVSTALELFFAFLEWELPRKIVKPFCVAFLSLMFAFWHPNIWWVALGFAFGAMGDVLLIFKHKVWTLVTGTICFFLNHLSFIFTSFWISVPMPAYQYWVFGGIAALILVTGYPLLHKAIKTPGLAAGGVIYLASIVLDLVAAVLALVNKMQPVGYFNLAGMLCFCVSDAYLVKTLFIQDDKRRDFYIMGTYLLAQVLILFGFGFYF